MMMALGILSPPSKAANKRLRQARSGTSDLSGAVFVDGPENPLPTATV